MIRYISLRQFSTSSNFSFSRIIQSSIQDQISSDYEVSCLIWKKIILTVAAQSNGFLHSTAITKHFSGENL